MNMWHIKPSSSRHWQNTWKKWTSSSRAWSLRLLKFSRVSSRILLHSQDTSAADHSNPPKAIKLSSLQFINNYAPLLLLLEHKVHLLEHKNSPAGPKPQSAPHLAGHPHRFLHHRCSRWFPGNQNCLKTLNYTSTQVLEIFVLTISVFPIATFNIMEFSRSHLYLLPIMFLPAVGSVARFLEC